VKHAIGIDLGTTHTALAHVPIDDDATSVGASPVVLDVPQLVAPHEVAARPLLPSFIFLPHGTEMAAGALALPWDATRTFAVGSFARERAATAPTRVVSSSKSWLSHAGVDRRSALLPVGARDDDLRMSPVEAATRILQHVGEAWAQAHPEAPLAEQVVVVTVPASFDEVARALTEEAARAAGIVRLTLLEEPQAALYAWVASLGDAWRKAVAVGDLILVVDVGGGTTDFSLIEVGDEDGQLALRRVAVGEHILLGGDNMDLALAWQVRTRLEAEGKTLDDWQMQALTHATRGAKELLLAHDNAASAPVVIPSRGSKLIGGSLKAELTHDDVTSTLRDGFFPLVDATARPTQHKRAGLQTLGLPYAHDAAITKHLAAFLQGRKPTRVLFNGGVMKAPALRARVREVLAQWHGDVDELQGTDLDTAVALGAAYAGRVRAGKGVRIKGGTARAYYVGIERAEPAVPGMAPRVDAVCVAPKGLEEGSEVQLPQALALVVGEPASFRFFQSATRDDVAASSVDPIKAALTEMAPIETTLEGEAQALVPVSLRARVTDVGTLALSAVEQRTGRAWKLEFQIKVE
jgi:molecular chaperone DnaK (HSP70)